LPDLGLARETGGCAGSSGLTARLSVLCAFPPVGLVIREVTAASEGTRMPRTSWKDLASVEVPWPDAAAAAEFSANVSALRNSVLALLNENVTLAAARDALLPQLMSGRLRVKDAEEIVEEVA
jgi:type I restriction enzyme, S subunit